jgi:hypothetical protein
MFKDMKEVTNVFKTGTVCIDVTECFCPPTHWNPCDCTRKIVHICNEGTKATYVRVKLIPKWDCGLPTHNVMFEPCDPMWVKIGNWYYYKKILGSDVELPCNKKCVTFNMVVKLSCCSGNEYQGKMFTLSVITEAVQAKHNGLNCEWGISECELHDYCFEIYPDCEDDCVPHPVCECDEPMPYCEPMPHCEPKPCKEKKFERNDF